MLLRLLLLLVLLHTYMMLLTRTMLHTRTIMLHCLRTCMLLMLLMCA